MKHFEELHQVLDEMSQRKEFINEETFSILIRRFVAAHKVEEAINIFYRREEFGLDNELDSEAFRTLLMWMCSFCIRLFQKGNAFPVVYQGVAPRRYDLRRPIFSDDRPKQTPMRGPAPGHPTPPGIIRVPYPTYGPPGSNQPQFMEFIQPPDFQRSEAS
ncbi:hypothetical protein MTR_1g079860 [Medicago truncatula]|uniref:Uncharacterized protein n=1 Tax=Medicago truncatula TaxID=3880 RepID=G7I681_MEDTR|nr:hypothetical protein MTR_1g079860 [Medicago truncatula]